MIKTRVFISYARDDEPEASRLFLALKSYFWIDPWIDKVCLNPGSNWKQEILNELDLSDAVLVLLSKKSIEKKGYVQKEIREALELADNRPPGDVYIIPICLDDVELKHPKLKDLNYVKLFSGFDEGVERIVSGLKHRKLSSREVRSALDAIKPHASDFLRVHPQGDKIVESISGLLREPEFPSRMSISGEVVSNPIFDSLDPVLRPIVDGALRDGLSKMRVMFVDLYLVKALDGNGAPFLLQYYSDENKKGKWGAWLFPHALGFQAHTIDRKARMLLDAKDFAGTAELGAARVDIDYVAKGDYLVSFKPDFGFRDALVLYVFMFCNVAVSTVAPSHLKRNFSVGRGRSVKKFRWFSLEALQEEHSAVEKNGDLIKAIKTLFASTLAAVPESIGSRLTF